jgi:hypothetical protein
MLRAYSVCRSRMNERRDQPLPGYRMLKGIRRCTAWFISTIGRAGFGLVFFVVTSVACTAIALTMDRWFGLVRW